MKNMTTTIAIGGKGGSGKTVIASLFIELLSEKGIVLAIDGDPSTNLNQALGLPLTETVGGAREEIAESIKRGDFDVGIPKPDYLDLRINEALVESEKIDLLAMGRPEGPGCYCSANQTLRISIDRLTRNYDYVVIDCEAGMEHISRRMTGDIDFLLLISDPTVRGITTAARMKELVGELQNQVGKIRLVVNRLREELPLQLKELVDKSGLELVATIPEDPYLADLEIEGKPFRKLPSNSPLKIKVREIANELRF